MPTVKCDNCGHSVEVEDITMTSIYADILPSENGKLANMIREVG